LILIYKNSQFKQLHNVVISRIILFSFLSSLFLFFTSCEKESQHPVPNVMVDIRINIENASYAGLNTIGNSIHVTGGYRGIIIFRVGLTEFTAFDRSCPHHPYEQCAVVNGLPGQPFGKCDCCETTYQLLDGSKFEGPSLYPLRAYRVTFNHPFLSISN
jgi:nitrite reductase/ring-hydroxylating ferredoxin subunit